MNRKIWLWLREQQESFEIQHWDKHFSPPSPNRPSIHYPALVSTWNINHFSPPHTHTLCCSTCSTPGIGCCFYGRQIFHKLQNTQNPQIFQPYFRSIAMSGIKSTQGGQDWTITRGGEREEICSAVQKCTYVGLLSLIILWSSFVCAVLHKSGDGTTCIVKVKVNLRNSTWSLPSSEITMETNNFR